MKPFALHFLFVAVVAMAGFLASRGNAYDASSILIAAGVAVALAFIVLTLGTFFSGQQEMRPKLLQATKLKDSRRKTQMVGDQFELWIEYPNGEIDTLLVSREQRDGENVAFPPDNAIALLRVFSQIDVQDIVPKVCCSTLVLHARGDSIIQFERGRSVAGLIRGAQFVPLESRNHVLLETEPAWQPFVEALDDFLPAHSKPAAPEGPVFKELTAREHEVLELVARGLDNTTIGARLHISERTARNHVSAILGKLGVNSRAQAIVRAREVGLGLATSR